MSTSIQLLQFLPAPIEQLQLPWYRCPACPVQWLCPVRASRYCYDPRPSLQAAVVLLEACQEYRVQYLERTVDGLKGVVALR